MKDKIVLLVRETGCEQGEAELALEMCGYDVEKALQAIPRLFQNVVALKGKAHIEDETLYALFLVILNLKERKLVRARAVASYDPAVAAVSLDRGWYEVEKHLYACRLREGAVQALSQELETVLSGFFGRKEAKAFYSEAHGEVRGKPHQALLELFARRFSPSGVHLRLHKDVLDLGQFQELGRSVLAAPAARNARAVRAEHAPGSLVLRVALDGDPEGVLAGELRAGDLVYAHINDARDVAQYLAKLFGSQGPSGSPLLVPVEAVETGDHGRHVSVRVRFSIGVCGDVDLPRDIRVRSVRKAQVGPWWKKLFGQ